MAGGSISKNTSSTSNFQSAPGPNLIKTHIGMTLYSMMYEVVEILQEIRSVDAERIFRLGGGSSIRTSPNPYCHAHNM